MTVVPFRRPRAQPRFTRPVEPPAALGGGGRRAGQVDLAAVLEDRRRMRQNWAALAVVVVLILLGAWLIERLRIYSRTLACIEAGHRSCQLIEPTPPPAR
jgi:hypothetical protein